MQWLLQEFDDTRRLALALDRLGIAYSWHKVVPFVGTLIPEPRVDDPTRVMMFGSYTLWRYARDRGLTPGVFKLRPFVQERVWQPFLLNGADAVFLTLRDVPDRLEGTGGAWFVRPVEDSKALAGSVKSAAEIIAIARGVLTLDPDEIPHGALRHDTDLMLSKVADIYTEWRIWVVEGQIVTGSLYKEGARVVYRPEVDPDALAFAQRLVDMNAGYATAYVMDICRTADGLKLLETNCINAAGFYAADLMRLAAAVDAISVG